MYKYVDTKLCEFCQCKNPENSFYKTSKTVDFYYCNKCLPKIRLCDCNHYFIPNKRSHVCDECSDILCKFCTNKKSDELEYCNNCRDKLFTCIDCGKEHITKFNKYMEICPDCFKLYANCKFCGKFHKLSTGKNEICKECVPNVEICKCCKRVVAKSDVLVFSYKEHSKSGCTLCITSCNCCGEVNAFADTSTCLECTVEGYYGCIKSYSYKPSPIFLGDVPADNLYLGIENEVAFPSGRVKAKVKYCGMLQKLHPNEGLFYVKRDGSVENGFEIVTHPMTVDYFHNHFPVKDLFIHKYTKVNDNCGMHIHMSKAAFGNAQIYKFMNFVHNNQDFIKIIAERGPNGFCQEVKKHTFLYKAKDKSGSDRDQVNLIPNNTIELRIFRGATTEQQYRKNVEFAICLFNFTKKCSITETTEEKFREYLANNAVLYPNLVKFLA